MEVYVPLAGLIDAEAERTRLGREEAKLERTLESAERKLANPQFQERAPTDVVERERRVAETRRQALEKVRRHLAELAANA
jgi:valyl-tRNA synthetase